MLVIESTYGDRLHEDRRTCRQRLEPVIEQALANNGTVLIPAFNIGRAQELLYELEDIIHSKKLNAVNKELWGRAALSPPLPTGEGLGERTKVVTEQKVDPQKTVNSAIDWPTLPIILDSPPGQSLYPGISRAKTFLGQ